MHLAYFVGKSELQKSPYLATVLGIQEVSQGALMYYFFNVSKRLLFVDFQPSVTYTLPKVQAYILL